MKTREDLHKIFSRIDGYREDVITMQRELTAIPALAPSSGGEGEWKKALKVKEYMEKVGYDEHYELNAPDESIPERKTRPNHVYLVKGREGGKTIWIMSHLDIVPPGERKLWESDPYVTRIDGDTIYGRGVEDNQQGLVSSILVLKALKEEGIKPAHNVALLVISDEETGNTLGIQHILKVKPDIFGSGDLVFVPDSGSEEGTDMEVAEKSILWVKVTTKGKQSHASRPHTGINAFKAASHLVVKCEGLYNDFAGKDPIFDPPGSTFEPTKKEANVPNVNSIPGEDVFYLDCRILPPVDLKAVKARIEGYAKEIEQAFGVTILVEYVQEQKAAPATSPDSPVVKALSAAIREVYGAEPKAIGIGGGTVAAYVRKAGLPAVVWARINETAHQPNEHCSIGNVLGDAKVFAHVCLSE
ncbi:MAG: M20 family metallo-hydrolase [Candidatus Eremiobacteraeota bacterium]|nr:M20 family metallo-hydrolase [Candidatus Eremiobacteraeota bacterium]